jgi:hypothetical protein
MFIDFRTYSEQLTVSKHALFQTSCEEVDVILHKFIDGALDLRASALFLSLFGLALSVALALFVETRHE